MRTRGAREGGDPLGGARRPQALKPRAAASAAAAHGRRTPTRPRLTEHTARETLR